MRGSAAIDRLDFVFDGMLRIPGRTFGMGSGKLYPEEAPVHSVTVDEFCIDRYRPAVRHAEPIDTSTSHVGFRCVKRVSRTRATFR